MQILDIKKWADYEEIECKTDVYDDEYVVKNDSLGDDVILIYGPLYRLRDTGILFAIGTYCVPDDNGEYIGDFSVTVLYKEIDGCAPVLDDYEYFEQDDPATTLHNYLNIIDHRELGTIEAELVKTA